jgi:hypothetical protein
MQTKKKEKMYSVSLPYRDWEIIDTALNNDMWLETGISSRIQKTIRKEVFGRKVK